MRQSSSGTQVLRLTGDLDSHTADGIHELLLAHTDALDDRPVDVDITGLGYLSSSGIALLLEAANWRCGSRPGVCG